MRTKFISATLLAWFSAISLMFALGESRLLAKDMILEVQLIWGTTNAVSPNPKHKPVEADVQKKLNELPLKWSNYFLVKSNRFEVAANGTTKVPLSEKCAIEVKNLGHSTVEVALYG